MSNDSCEPALVRSDFSDLAPLSEDDTVARNIPTLHVSAQPESRDRQACNTSYQTESLDACKPTVDGQFKTYQANSSEVGSVSKKQVTYKYKEMIRKEITINGRSFLAAITTFKKPVTDTYKHFMTVFHHQRSVWIVPVLQIIDKPSEYFQLISPYMPGESLEKWLKNCKLKTREQAVTIVYQIMAGLAFLHSRHVVHGDLNPRHVLFDQYGNVRLVCYGMYTAYSVEEDVVCRQADSVHSASVDINSVFCFISDLRCLAKILLQLLMPAGCTEQEQSDAMSDLTSSFHNLQKSYDSDSVLSKFDCMSFVQTYVDEVMWPADTITCRTIEVLLRCLYLTCTRTCSTELKDKLKSIMEEMKLPRIFTTDTKHNDEICRYCTVDPVHPELQLRRTSCPETCPFLRACISCMCLLGSQRYVCRVNNDVCSHSVNSNVVETICPRHQCTIEPVIGGGRAHAMILHCDSPDIGDNTKDDAMSMVQLASHPNVMQIPFKNVHLIAIPDKTDSTFEQQCKRVETEMKQILGRNPSFFLFYFSGHQLVQADKNNELLPQYDSLVRSLINLISRLAEKCPRMLLIFDCCRASAVAYLFEVLLDDDSHVEWCAYWVSCRQKQDSNIDEGYHQSRFAEAVQSSLKGGTQTPCSPTEKPCALETKNHYRCSMYRKSCNANGYVTLQESADFVRHCLHYRQCKTQESPTDVQDPLYRGTFAHKAIISFVNKEPWLYTFFVKDMFDGTIHRYETDDLHVGNIWRMTAGHHSKEAHHVKFYDRHTKELLVRSYASDKDMPNIDIIPILDAVSKDSECLLVEIDDTPVDNEDDDESSSSQTEDSSDSSSSQPGNADGSSDDFVQFKD